MRACFGTRGARWAVAVALLAAAQTGLAQRDPRPQWPTPTPPRGYLSVGAGIAAHATDCAGSRQCDRVGGAGPPPRGGGGAAAPPPARGPGGGGGARAALGLFVTPVLALEVAAVDFGQGRIGDGYGDAEFGVRLVGVGIALPLEYGARFNGLLRLGVAGVRATLRPLPAGTAPSSTGSSIEGYYGLTLGYMLTPLLAAELSFDGTRGYVGHAGGRVDALALGLSLRF